MRNRFVLYFSFLIAVFVTMIFTPSTSYGATSPYDVEESVKSNWNSIYGHKNFSQTSGKKIIYDVYSTKYTSGGYQIVTKNFGYGSKQYVNFQGWAVLMGYKHHTSSNHETYIVAKKVSGDSGVGTTKVYGTLPINISATEDLEYNNQGPNHVYNECPASATYKDNQYDCNMRYDWVGFNAYLPLDELFPKPEEKASWSLYLVKRVESRIVYTPLVLPFYFGNKKYYGGEISLSSGVNTNSLQMIGTYVLRRSYPRQSASSVWNELGSDRYFTTNNFYTRVSADETETAIWYGVKSYHDNNQTKWANTAYWLFGGTQATIQYIPEDTPPQHISHELWGHTYRNGNDYWTKPNQQVYIRLRQRDQESGNKYQYLRLYGSGLDVRSQHHFYESATHNNHFWTSSHVSIDSAYRDENTQYGRVRWGVTPKTHGHSYNIHYYYQDKAGNSIGYNDTYMNLRVDGQKPNIQFRNESDTMNYYYRNWHNSPIKVRLKFSDSHSGYKRSRYVWSNSPDYYNSSNLSNWTTSSNYVVSQENYGAWYLHVIAEDNVGNTAHIVKGAYRLNHYPIANFETDKNEYLINTMINITSLSSDPDGHYLEHLYEYRKVGTTNWIKIDDWRDTSFSINDTGDFEIRLTVTDPHGFTDTIIKTIKVYNNAPIAQFNTNKTRYRPLEEIFISSNAYDPDYHNITHEYYYRKQGTSNWTMFSTMSHPTIQFEETGFYEIRQVVKDEYGATDSITKTIEVYNNKPDISVSHSPSTVYEGDDVTLELVPVDPDGDRMDVKIEENIGGDNWQVIYEIENTHSGGTINHTIEHVNLKDYVLRITTTDIYGLSHVETYTFEVNELIIIGSVEHTAKWAEYHELQGNPPNFFLSGEQFIVKADVTNHPIRRVSVKFTGEQVNGEILEIEKELDSYHPHYRTEVYDESMSLPETKLKTGSVSFLITAEWQNGIIKHDLIEVEIIDDVYNAYFFRRTN